MSPRSVARLRIGPAVGLPSWSRPRLGNDLRVAGVAPDLMVLLTICAGLTGGAEAGAWVGFWAGLLADLFLTCHAARACRRSPTA